MNEHGKPGVANGEQSLAPRFKIATERTLAFYESQPSSFDFKTAMMATGVVSALAHELYFIGTQPQLATKLPGATEALRKSLQDPNVPLEIREMYYGMYPEVAPPLDEV